MARPAPIPVRTAGHGLVRNPALPCRSPCPRRRLPGTPWTGVPRARRLRCAPGPTLRCAAGLSSDWVPGRPLRRCGSRAPGPSAVAAAGPCPTRTTARSAGIGLPAAPRHLRLLVVLRPPQVPVAPRPLPVAPWHLRLPVGPRHRRVSLGSLTRMSPASCGSAGRARAAGWARASPGAGPGRPKNRCPVGGPDDPAARQAGVACCSGSGPAWLPCWLLPWPWG